MNALLLMLATIPPYADGVPATYPTDVLLAAATVQQSYSEARSRIDAAMAADPTIEVDKVALSRLYARASKMEWQHSADGGVVYTGGPVETRQTWLWTHDSDPRDCWRAVVALRKIADEIGGQR